MAIAFVKDFYSESNTLTVPAAGVARNNLIVLGMYHDDDAHQVTAINDTGGNIYTQLPGSPMTNSGRNTAYWYAVVTTALVSGNSITLTQVGSTAGCVAAEFSGCATSSPLDRTATKDEYAIGTTQNHTSSLTAATTQADELLVGVHGSDNSALDWTATGSFTMNEGATPFGVYCLVMQYRVVSATATYESTGTTVGFERYLNLIGTFKAAATGTPVLVPRHALGGGRW